MKFLAQADGSAPPAETASTTLPEVATTTKPAPVVPRPTPTVATTSVTSPVDSNPTTTLSVENSSNNLILGIVAGVAVLIALGYWALQSQKTSQKDKDDGDPHCFNIKKLLESKLQELTDLKSRAKEKVVEGVLETTQGTKTGNILALIEHAEREYERLSRLYEECVLEHSSNMYKGTIVENSLSDKSVLDKLKLVKTWQDEDWTLHDVLVEGSKADELGKSMTSGPWYMHFWIPGKDEIKVVYKDKSFDIKASDKSTWTEAIAYGKSKGIPEEQLDFMV